MKKILLLCYKCGWLFVFKTKNFVCTFLLRVIFWVNNVSVGEKMLCLGGGLPLIRISKNAKSVSIAKNAVFNNYNDVGWYSKCSIWVKDGAILSIGDFFGMNGGLIYASEKIMIGTNVKIGGGTKIFDTDFHPLNYEWRRSATRGTKSAPIIIEDDVFIGTSCLILKGVTIGARSIVAAGSVVSKSIPADEIWGGNPARFIRKIDVEVN